jgi:PAS domain S-box-containing protein
MSLILTLFNETPFFLFPDHWSGWLGLTVWLGLILYLLFFWRRYWGIGKPSSAPILVILLVAAPLTSLFLGIKLPTLSRFPLPGVTLEPGGLPLMIFSALPWVLAGGLIGPLAAVIVAGVVGLCWGYWGTHSLSTPLELATLAIVWSLVVQQRFRTDFFRFLRHPFVGAVFVSLLYPLLFLTSSLLVVGGSLAVRFDYAISHGGSFLLATLVSLLLAGLMAEFFRLAFPDGWGGQPPWQPSPAEKSLAARYFSVFAPSLAFLIIVFILGDWFLAGRAARQILQARMSASAEAASESIPYFLNTGQSLIIELAANPRLALDSQEQIEQVLEDDLRTVPFFHQFFVLNGEGDLIYKTPGEENAQIPTTLEEQIGLDMALNGVPVQFYTLSPLTEQDTAQISFFAAIPADQGVAGVLVGRTEFNSNPFAKPVLTNLDSLSDVGGLGLLVDDQGAVLYQSDGDFDIETYRGDLLDDVAFYDGTAPDGARQLIYYRPVSGQPWSVVLMVPARQAQQLALNIAAPLLAVILLLAGLAFVLMRFSFGMMTSSLKALTEEAERIAQGRLDRPLQVDSVDEIGRLRRAFEKMRLALKSRLDELNRLLLVSQGVASSLEIEDAMGPILESALTVEASSARIVLAADIVPEGGVKVDVPARYGNGKLTRRYRYYDDQILKLIAERDVPSLILNEADRASLQVERSAPPLGAAFAIALRHENIYLGVLWVGYQSAHTFTDQEIQFLTTLAGQAGLAITNARLFMTAEFERERLAAILTSTPDPVLVTDQYDRLLLVNPVAWKALDIEPDVGIGRRIGEVIEYKELVALLRIDEPEQTQEHVEVVLPDGKVYLATASTIEVEGRRIGRVCVLQDVTYFKELDNLKSEFVSQVSHDLRSPLTLMRGYATMLEMVGELNEQQSGYVRKIVIGIESMSRLINNLLDLGRIEAGVGLQLQMLLVEDIVEQVLEAFQVRSKQKGIQLRAEIGEDVPPLIEADQALLQQALHNLVENAIKYTPEGGEVSMRLRKRGKRILFEIEDTGIGVSDFDKPHLFEKFYRSADRKAKKERGTGLGLAIVKSIVERHGGHVGVESELGEGSRFWFEVPVQQNN